MKPEQQRVAIAEARGYTHVRIIKSIDGSPDIGIGHHPTEPHSVPDYLNDLNAMHEAEQMLSGEQKEQFIFWLNHLHPSADIHYAEKKRELRLDVFDLVHTTAPQRAEAFLRTLGLWQETPTQPQ